MKFEFDEMGIKDNIELINIQRQFEQKQIINEQTLGFNLDTLYNQIDKQENTKI